MISILVTGISGRMGQAVQEAVTQNPDTCVGATYDQGQELYPALAKCDVAIDFSHHAFTSTLLAEAVANNKPLVIGTTGHTELERQEIMDAAASIPDRICVQLFRRSKRPVLADAQGGPDPGRQLRH